MRLVEHGICRRRAPEHEARLLIFTGRNRPLEGKFFAVPQLVVLKGEDAAAGAGMTWSLGPAGADQRLGARWPLVRETPRVLLDVRGPQAAGLDPQGAGGRSPTINTARRRLPGLADPNTILRASVLRVMPELATTLHSDAIGKDFSFRSPISG